MVLVDSWKESSEFLYICFLNVSSITGRFETLEVYLGLFQFKKKTGFFRVFKYSFHLLVGIFSNPTDSLMLLV